MGAAAPYYRKLHWSDVFNRAMLVALGLVVLAFVIIMKSKTTVTFAAEPILYAYAIFVTSFELSRMIGAMLYEKAYVGIFANVANPLSDEFEPAVTFIIPCKNEEKAIARTVVKCFASVYSKEKLEVIVINDGSTDHTAKILANLQNTYPNLQVVNWEKNRGKRQGMAEGFRRANGEIIIQLDSDSYIDPKTFRNIITPFQNKEIAAVCAHADPQNADKNFITKMQAAYYFMSFRVLKAAESTFMSVFCCSGCSSAYRKDMVMPVLDQWLNERFLGLPVTWGDDRALTSQLLKLGHKTVYTDQVAAYTIVPENWKQLLTQQLRWKKSWIINAIFTSKFIWRKQPFVAALYYFPLIFVSFMTPFMTVRALLYLPFIKGVAPFFHIIGVMLITALLAVFCRILSKKESYWPYLFAWSIFNLFVLSFILFWAAIKIQDRGWGTR